MMQKSSEPRGFKAFFSPPVPVKKHLFNCVSVRQLLIGFAAYLIAFKIPYRC